MKKLGKLCASVLALTAGAWPMLASASCLNDTDMHAVEAAALQQRLTVAAFTCHDAGQYNAFVLGHRGELQREDADLMTFFKRTAGSEAAYHTYKTHLANAAAVDSARDDGFCQDASALFRYTSHSGSLNDMLDGMPVNDTGYSACQAPRVQTASADDQRDYNNDDRYSRPHRDRDSYRTRRDDRYDDGRYADNPNDQDDDDDRDSDRGPSWHW